MMEPVRAKPSRPGRPRSESSRQAILRAAGELLLERGLAGTSMEAIAERAGAGKATIYRWWPSKELLAVEALRADWEGGADPGPDTGSLAGDLRALTLPWVQRLTRRPYARLIAGLLASAQSDERFGAAYRSSFVERRRERARAAFARAIEREEIPRETDVEAALDLLYGPIYHRLLHGHAELSGAFAEQVVKAVLAAVAAPPDPPHSPSMPALKRL